MTDRKAPATCLLTLLLTGCVFTQGATYPAEATSAAAVPLRDAANIAVSCAPADDRRHIALGKVSGSATALNLVSSNPTRADVDEALRMQAARLGANAVVAVTYRFERTGLNPRGRLLAEGSAVRYVAG